MHCSVIQWIGWGAIETVLIVIDFESVLVVYVLNMYLVDVPCIYVSTYLRTNSTSMYIVIVLNVLYLQQATHTVLQPVWHSP